MAIKICIVDDRADIRSVLEQIISMSSAYKLLGSFDSGEEAVRCIPELKPHIVLMDINLGGISGIECVRQLKAIDASILYMMCTVYEDDEKIFDALSAGASGYILKKTSPAKLLEALAELSNGGAPMSSLIARKVVSLFQQKQVYHNASSLASVEVANNVKATLAALSLREAQILEFIAKGLTYKEISAHLFISAETVKKHVYKIYEKLHVSNKVEALNKFLGR